VRKISDSASILSVPRLFQACRGWIIVCRSDLLRSKRCDTDIPSTLTGKEVKIRAPVQPSALPVQGIDRINERLG